MSSILIAATGDGTFVHSVRDVQPPPRFSAAEAAIGPWTSIRAYESVTSYGPWTLLGAADLVPVDIDPAEPQPRDVTVTGARLQAWLRLELLDVDGNIQPITPIHTTRPIPSVDEIASRIRQRTRDRDGYEHGTFNELTRPVASEVADIAQRAARFVMLKLGDPGTRWTGDLMSSARDAAAARAALEVETSYYSGAGDPALVEQLGRIAREELDAVVATGRNNQPGGWRFASITQTNRTPDASTSLQPGQIGNG